MQQTLEKIGKQVFYKRLQQKMTQEELCQGICSVSYLSKIENGKIEASEEILQLLCARLEIAVSDLRDVEAEVKEKLDEWLNALVHLDKQQVERIYNELQAEMKHVLDFEIINYYKLLYTRYLIMKRDLPALEEELEKLKKMYKKYSPFQKMLYAYSKGLLYSLQYKYKQALEYLLETESMAKEQGYYETGIYYNLGLAYSHLDIPHLAMHFANIAMEGFRNEYKFRYVINCQTIIALSYAEKGQYEEALKIYGSILREVDSFAEKDMIKAMTLNNMGELYQYKKEYNKAKLYFLQSFELQNVIDMNYIETMYGIAKQCIYLKQYEEAKEWIEKGISCSQSDEKYHKMILLFCAFKYKYFEKPVEFKRFLETEAIPFFKNAGNVKELKNAYLELAMYFEEQNEYEESNKYYKEAIKVLEKKEELN
ncbi:helix-turn-helix transcriptional regulator [Bacillus sp. XF8]|uniref:helix-turn-helix transcriptional regulator n=1 Tax=Bacillus sp. XF8 TaxID=2819289 RepID=UPI001AA042A2|nr:helix-turn-helix transcriptional regulator [Bacillus sp. XF8]MBO1579918.1 helix-turn-helix transcriptional regulator [Bacillus sp. XF8]